MSKILITGGTGLIGKRLSEMLMQKAHEVVILSRKPKQKNEFKWSISDGFIDDVVFKNLNYIIHLAGSGIADGRWTDQRKKTIINSRVETANLLFDYVKKNKVQLKGFISASGIGFYGSKTTDKIFTESDAPNHQFISQVCIKWEEAALQFESLDIPVSIFRTGIVLAKSGGALKKMLTPVISPLGTGKQYMPWIHLDDLCNMYIWSIDNQQKGIFNAVTNDHQTNAAFSKTLARSTKRPYLGIPVPSFVLKTVFGELSSILLEGSRISADKISKSGFHFQFPYLNDALTQLYKNR